MHLGPCARLLTHIKEIRKREHTVTGAARVFIAPHGGQADDIAVGPQGELAWTSFLHGALRYRERDDAPIRVLAKGLPGINSLDFDRRNGPDGMLYGPLWFKHQVVKIDPANGAITVISSDFQTPAAANLDGKGNLWVVDARTGELSRVELATGRKTVARQFKPALDNLAIAPEGTIYVSNMADNSIESFQPATGEVRLLTSGKLPVPAGLRIEGDRMWVAAIFALREVDLKTGNVTDLKRMWASDLEYPGGVGVSARHLALTSGPMGAVQQIERASMKAVATGHGFKGPVDAIPMADGSILVAEMASSSILRVSGPQLQQREVVVQGLDGPVQMTLGRDGHLYVTEAGGSLTRVNLADKSKATVANRLSLPKGIAQTPWGSFVVLEAGTKRLTEIDLATGERRTVASNLPVGMPAAPGMPAVGLPTGVAADGQGNIYFSSDLNNAVYKVRPQP